MSDVLRSMNMI